MSRKKEPAAPLLADTFEDPQGFIFSLIGAEVLATRREDGPLARPWRARPRSQTDVLDIGSASPARTPKTNHKEGSRG